jgi:hypothetical protein
MKEIKINQNKVFENLNLFEELRIWVLRLLNQNDFKIQFKVKLKGF